MHYVAWNDIVSERVYPAGERHLMLNQEAVEAIPSAPSMFVVECPFRTLPEMEMLLHVHGRLRMLGKHPNWLVPYLPHGREDKIEGADLFQVDELFLVLQIARDAKAWTVDPHGEKAAACRHIPQDFCVDYMATHAGLFDGNPVVVVPDAGADRKAAWAARFDRVVCSKQRDPSTGQLHDFRAPFAEEWRGRPCVIYDDICDGGGTFLGLAKLLKEQGAGPLTLATTHGLYTKTRKWLDREFKRVLCFEYKGASGPLTFENLWKEWLCARTQF